MRCPASTGLGTRWYCRTGPRGMPRTVIEAMSSGLPVVASDLEQVAPVVERAGVAVPVGDVEGFAAGLDGVLEGDRGDPRAVAKEGFD